MIYFYLIESPSVEGKASSNQFTDLHALWGIHCFDRTADSLRGRLMRHKVEGILDNLGGVAKSEKDMLGRLKQFGLFEIDSLKNLDIKSRVVMVDSKSNQYLSLFSHIRNSLAHGSFRFCNREDAIYFVFQDSYRKHVTARGIIEIEILKKWKDIILDKV